MGFFSDLIKRETKKIMSDVVDNAIGDTFKKPISETSTPADMNGRGSSDSPKRRESGESKLRARLEQILADEWADYEIKKQVPPSELGEHSKAKAYSYGIYRYGQPRAMIMILTDRNQYRRKEVLLAKEACERNGIPYMNFMSHLPNTSEYISNHLKENILL